MNIKNFFKKIGLTFYSSNLYSQARDRSVGNGLTFLLKVLLFLSLIFSLIIFLLYILFAPKMEKQLLDYVEKSYPNDLVVTIKDKTLSTNTNEPVFFPVIGDMHQLKNNVKQNIVVLAPNESSADIELLSKYDTYMIVTSKSILAQSAESEFRTYLLNYENVDINKSKVTEIVIKIFKTLMTVVLIFSIPSFLFILGALTIKHLVTLLFVSFLLYGIFKFQNINITYKQVYRMGVYSVVPVLLISIILFPFHLGSTMLDVFIMLAVLLYVNKDRQEENAIQPVE